MYWGRDTMQSPVQGTYLSPLPLVIMKLVSNAYIFFLKYWWFGFCMMFVMTCTWIFLYFVKSLYLLPSWRIGRATPKYGWCVELYKAHWLWNKVFRCSLSPLATLSVQLKILWRNSIIIQSIWQSYCRRIFTKIYQCTLFCIIVGKMIVLWSQILFMHWSINDEWSLQLCK